MKHVTTIEIAEIETEVLIDFEMQSGEIVINKMTDTHSGDAIAPDLLDETSTDSLYPELYEAYADAKAERRNNGKHSINY